MDKLRSRSKELECKAGGVNMAIVQKESESMLTLKKNHEKEIKVLTSHLNVMKEKMKWYIDNQEILDKNDLLISSQKEEIESLKKKLNASTNRNPAQSATSAVKKKGNGENNRIRILEDQVKELEEALRKRNPDSLSNLIRAAGPSEEDLKERTMLLAKVSDLQLKLSTKDEEMDKSLRVLRMEHERVLASLNKQCDKLQEEKSSLEGKVIAVKRDVKVETKEKEDVKEIERVRNFYAKKIKTLGRNESDMQFFFNKKNNNIIFFFSESKLTVALQSNKRGNTGELPLPPPSSSRRPSKEEVNANVTDDGKKNIFFIIL